MYNKFKLVFIGLLCAITMISNNASATHLAGGELTWKCVIEGGVSKYQFKLVLYRNCEFNGGQAAGLPNAATIQVDNLNGELSQTLNAGRITAGGDINVTRISVRDISPSCSFGGGSPLDCTVPDRGALEKHTYISQPIDFNGVLPPTDPNTPFVFSWNTCCRNNGIINIGVDGQSGTSGSLSMFLISKMFPFYPNGSTTAKAVNECFDSSPDFTEAPAAILYLTGLDFTFNNNANDVDLDNLYYKPADPVVDLTDVLSGTFDPATLWVNYPFRNPSNPLGLLPDQYSFNNYTGEFTFKPLVPGNFVTSFCVAAYKCDQKVAEVYRDFQSRILTPDENQNINKFPTLFPPFIGANNVKTSELSIIAGNTLHIPIVIRDSTAGGLDISLQDLEITVNGAAMGSENDDTIDCPYPPCAMLTKSKYDYDYVVPGNTVKPIPIQNTPGEVFGYGYSLGPRYGTPDNTNPDTLWVYWPTSCANLDKKDDCNGLTSSRYNFVVTAKDNFCRVPGKTIRTFSVNILAPDFYLSPPIRCITYDQITRNVRMNWGISTGDTNTFVRYEVYRNNTLLFSTTNRRIYEYVDISPEASPDSTYYVRAINLCGVEDEVSPVKPIQLDAVFYKSNEARLVWNHIRTPNMSSFRGYNVYRSQTENPFVWEEIIDYDGDTTNSFAIDRYDLCSDTTYYKVEGYDSIGCVSMSTIDTIFHPTLTAAVKSDTVCQGTPTQFVVTGLGGGIPPYRLVRWIGEEGFSADNADTALFIFPSHGKKAYTFTVIDSKGCRLDITDTAFVRQLPEFTMVSDSACPFSIINFGLNITSPVPIDSVFWLGDYDVAQGKYLFEKSGPYFDPLFSFPKWIFSTNNGVGKFPIIVTLKDIYGCTTTIVDTAKTGEPFIELLSDPNQCFDTKKDSIKILPRYLTKPYNTVQWIDNNTNQVLYQMNDGKDAFPLSIVAGRRYVNLRVRIEDVKGCQAELTQQFTLAPWYDFKPDSLCIGDVTNLKIVYKPISDTANYTYLWELDASTISTEREPMHTYVSSGPKIISLLVTDTITGCTTFIKDTLTVRDPMLFNITVDLACAGEETVFRRILDPSRPALDTAWEWTIDESPNVIPNNTIVLTDKDSVANIMLPPSDGYYRISLRVNDALTGCWTTIDTIMKVYNQPDIDFDVDSLNCAGQSTQFISKVVGNTPPYTYSWVGEDNFIDTVANPIHIYPENGEEYYTVSLSVTNNAGCVVTKTKQVRVCDDKRTIVNVPQVFSPGREKNNTLQVSYTNVDNFSFTVYNRWGVEVFSTIDPDFVWDGKDQSGEYLLTGTYVYIINANGLGKRNYLNKGTIAVVR